MWVLLREIVYFGDSGPQNSEKVKEAAACLQARAATSKEIFAKDEAEKLEIREIIAISLRKH